MPNLKRTGQRYQHKQDKRKPTGDQKFVTSNTWRKLSRRYRKVHPLCEACYSIELVEPATLCDHIVARSLGGSLYDTRNLMALCSPCHDRKSGREAYGLTMDVVHTADGLIPRHREDGIKMALHDWRREDDDSMT